MLDTVKVDLVFMTISCYVYRYKLKLKGTSRNLFTEFAKCDSNNAPLS